MVVARALEIIRRSSILYAKGLSDRQIKDGQGVILYFLKYACYLFAQLHTINNVCYCFH